jgi:hypothetical protein
MTSASGGSDQASDNTANTQGQASQVNNSGVSSAASQGQASSDNTAASTTSLSPADYDRMIAELRRENATHRTKLKSFEDAQAAADAAKLSDLEKASKRAESAENALKAARARIGASELKMAAQAAGIIDTDIAAALLSTKVEYGADGEPTNIAELVAGLKKDKPNLFPATNGRTQAAGAAAQNTSSGGAANPGRAAGNGGLTLEMIQQMPMRERIARMDEIKAWEKAQAGASNTR